MTVHDIMTVGYQLLVNISTPVIASEGDPLVLTRLTIKAV